VSLVIGLGGCALSRYETHIADNHSVIGQRTEQWQCRGRATYPGPTPSVVNGRNATLSRPTRFLWTGAMTLPDHHRIGDLAVFRGGTRIKTIALR
jgi:hypothetical protein